MQHLPVEILLNHVLPSLPVFDVLSCSLVSQDFWSLSVDQQLWKALVHRDFSEWCELEVPAWGDYRKYYSDLSVKYKDVQRRIDNSEYSCQQAIEDRELLVLKKLRSLGVPWGDFCFSSAAYIDDDRFLEYLFEEKCPWDHMTCTNLSHRGNLKYLKVACENGAPVDRFVYSITSKECFMYLHSLGIPLPVWFLRDARKLGWLE
jgi:hypothetical protein